MQLNIYTGLIMSSIICSVLIIIASLRLRHAKRVGWRSLSIGVLALLLGASAVSNSLISVWVSNLGILSFQDPLLTLVGPTLYWRCQRLLEKQIKPSHWCLHFSMFVLSLAMVIYIYFVLGSSEAMSQNEGRVKMAIEFLAFAQLWLYFTLCFTSLRSYRRKLENHYSEIDSRDEAWQSRLLAALGLTYGGISLVYALNHGVHAIAVNQSIAIMTALLVLYVTYLSLTRPEFLNIQTHDAEPNTLTDKYQKSGLSTADRNALFTRLNEKISGEKLYLDPDLSAAALAKALGISKQHLSETINAESQQSFYDFINGFRVAEVQNMLHQGDRRSLIDIAFDCGFNSKASFHRHFKKVTGQSPGHYRRNTSTKASQPVG